MTAPRDFSISTDYGSKTFYTIVRPNGTTYIHFVSPQKAGSTFKVVPNLVPQAQGLPVRIASLVGEDGPAGVAVRSDYPLTNLRSAVMLRLSGLAPKRIQEDDLSTILTLKTYGIRIYGVPNRILLICGDTISDELDAYLKML